jgi:hypothetical protein
MVDPIQELVAVEEIKRLKARYCRHLDDESWDGFGSVFWADATFETEGMRFDDAETFVAGIVRHHAVAKVRTVHRCCMPEIELRSSHEATGIWAMHDYVDRVWADDGRREAFHGWGHYHEAYRREGEGAPWRIASMRLTRLRIDPVPDELLPSFPERGAAVVSLLRGAADAD